jgi:hypothetical protein
VRVVGGHREADLGALAGRGPDRGRAAVPPHPVDDAVAHAEPVLGHRALVEALAAVADEDLDPLRRALREDVDLLGPIASRAASTSGRTRSETDVSPTVTTSTGTP